MDDNSQFSFETNCQDCFFYIMIDSGYGYCRRYPPTEVKKIKFRWLKLRFETLTTYPCVEWCRKQCGEFIAKSTQKIKVK